MIDDRFEQPSHGVRDFESEPSDEWRENYGRGGPVRSNEPERDWFFEQNVSRADAQQSIVESVGAGPSMRGGTHYARVSYRGRGPRGYRPSDERLRELICERLTDHPRIDASDIEVDVQSGIVHLSGTIPDPAMRQALMEVIGQIYGVAGVVDRIIVAELRLS